MRFVVAGLIFVNLLKSSGVLRVGNLQAHLLVKLFLYNHKGTAFREPFLKTFGQKI